MNEMAKDHDEVRTEDLKAFVQVSRAFWSDRGRAEQAVVETLSAAALLDLSTDQTVERAASALLERAVREGMAANSRMNIDLIHQPFYRLSPEERFLLVALHGAKWSYSRVARILNRDPEALESLAWNTRVVLASSDTAHPGQGKYPIGSKVSGVNCPDYHSNRPWTQRFMDDEIPAGAQKLFLQNHVLACGSCRTVLTRCREIYFTVDAMVPRLAGSDQEDAFLAHLRDILRRGKLICNPSHATFFESLGAFVQRVDVQVALVCLVGLVGLMFVGK